MIALQTAHPSETESRAARAASSGSQDGFLLIEVMISAMLVGLIVVATFTGFDVTNRVTAEQRHRNEAALLAAESQQQLRSDSAGALDELQTAPHTYTRTVDKTLYTIEQKTGLVNDSEVSASCEAKSSSQSSHNGDYLRITSVVSWPQQKADKRPEVTQSSIITPPVGSALEVDVGNFPTPTAGVSGVTAIVKFTPVKGSSVASLEATTGAAGCVIFDGIPSTEATLEVIEKIGWVTTTGAVKVPAKEVTITPNLTTHQPVTLNEGGAIEAKFSYEGKTTAEVLKKGPETVKGDTFVVANNESKGSTYEVGSTAFEYEAGGEERYTAQTGGYGEHAFTPGVLQSSGGSIKYPRGDLFPFPAPSKWAVYAGDCTSNNTGKTAEGTGQVVEPGKTSSTQVPLSYVKLTVTTGTGSGNVGAVEAKNVAKITNTACASAVTPNNGLVANYVHVQELSPEGHLSDPFQPFGAATLCVANKTAKRTYSISYTNTTTTPQTASIYLGQRATSEFTSQKSEEALSKTAREKAETEAKPAKEQREKEETSAKTAKTSRESAESSAKTAKASRESAETAMTNARVAREKKEKEEREKWVTEEKTKTLSPSRASKEATQTAARKEKEKEEATARSSRETEETAAASAKAKRETEETEAASAKLAREKAETEAKPAKEKREKEETTATATRTAREKEEKEASENKSVTVTAGKSEC